MILFVKMLMVLQMLTANLHMTLKSSRLKRGRWASFAMLFITSIVFFGVLYAFGSNISEENLREGDGLYLILALIYYIPIRLITDQPVRNTITIMATSWVYTIFIYIISHRLAYYIDPGNLQTNSLLIQTALYLTTYRIYYRFMNEKFIYTIRNMDRVSMNILMTLSISMVNILFLMNYSYVNGHSLFTEMAEPVLLIIISTLSLQLASSFVRSSKNVEAMSRKIQKDPLTRLGNREAMMDDANGRISRDEAFGLIFADLDRFKEVNDTHGHQAGDDYLVSFANTARKHLGPRDKLYRISGDEFVILCGRENCKDLIEKLDDFRFLNNPRGIEFLGLSTGHAYYPEEHGNLVDLLTVADERMYQEKKIKHKNSPN